MKKFIGMDPSYNGFGVVTVDENGETYRDDLFSSSGEVEERIIYFEEECLDFILELKDLEMIYIEGPSFSSKGQFMLEMGALHYYLRIFFIKNNLPFKVIPPNTLKKYVCGKGNAKKDLMLLFTYKKWGAEFDDHNKADAYGLARMALEDYQNEQTN